jgi:lysophospholipase
VDSVDWRGQGGSGRLIEGSALGHAEDFSRWLDDIEAYGRDWRARTQGPHVIVAHSMGAHLVLRALAENRMEADAVAAFGRRCLGIHTGALPVWLAPAIIAAACGLRCAPQGGLAQPPQDARGQAGDADQPHPQRRTV